MKGFALSPSFESENLWELGNGLLINPAEITVKIPVLFIFLLFFDKLIAPKKGKTNQVGWRQLHYKNKNCNNITAKNTKVLKVESRTERQFGHTKATMKNDL